MRCLHTARQTKRQARGTPKNNGIGEFYDMEYTNSNASGSPSRVSEYSYDEALHQFLTEERSLLESGYLSNRYTINYDSAFGGIAVKTDPNGNSTWYDYDRLGRLSQVRADTDAGMVITSAYSYDIDFPLSTKVTQYSGTSDMNSELRVYFDGMGRELHSVRSATDESGRRFVKSGMLVYDALGRLIRKSQSSFAGDGEIDGFVPSTHEKNPTTTEYDAIGRVKKITLPHAEGESGETSIANAYNDPFV